MVEIQEVRSKKTTRDFLNLPHLLYKQCQFHTPLPRFVESQFWSVKRNPYFKDLDTMSYIAYRSGVPVGRLQVTLDPRARYMPAQPHASFGFFDCQNDPVAAAELFHRAQAWAISRGAKALVGPFNPSINGTCGILQTGFESAPGTMMAYNHPYYVDLVQDLGFKVHKRLVTFTYSRDRAFPEKIYTHAQRQLHERGITVRSLNMKRFKEELFTIMALANDSMSKHWGYLPMSEQEIVQAAQGLRWILDPELVVIAEKDNESVGFLLAFPDIHARFIDTLWSPKRQHWHQQSLWRLLHLAYRLGPGARHQAMSSVRFAALGLRQDHQTSALGTALYAEIWNRCYQRGVRTGEASWVLDENSQVMRVHRRLGGVQDKAYVIVAKDLQGC
jgi:hypothetical protein